MMSMREHHFHPRLGRTALLAPRRCGALNALGENGHDENAMGMMRPPTSAERINPTAAPPLDPRAAPRAPGAPPPPRPPRAASRRPPPAWAGPSGAPHRAARRG